jgi:hypothetical protein
MKNLKLKNYIFLTNDENKKLLNIRNNDEIRQDSLSQNFITLNEHLSWVDKLKDDETKHYFAVIYNDYIVGGVNIFDTDLQIKWGLFFSKNTSLMIKSIIPIYFMDYIFNILKYEKLYAQIKKKNINAISYNKNLGFEVVKDENIVTMELNRSRYLKAKDGIILKRIIKKMALYNLKMEINDG